MAVDDVRAQNPGSWDATVPMALGLPPPAPAPDAPERPAWAGLHTVRPHQDVPLAGAEAPTLKLVVKGLKPVERRLLEGTVMVSKRRNPRLELLPDAQAMDADVLMIDTRDADAIAWANQQPWMADRAVIWIDAVEVAAGHTLARRPVQWPILPMMLARALENGPGSAAAKAAAPQAAPAADVPAAVPAAPAGLAPLVGSEPTPSRRILVVDDSLAVRAYLRSQLEARGYEVVEAADAERGIAAAVEQPPTAILMDVLMPGVDGYEACRRIKAKLRGADAVPVLMLTSKGSPFDRIRGKMAGCDAYLTKPVDPAELSAALAQHAQGRKPAPAGGFAARATAAAQHGRGA